MKLGIDAREIQDGVYTGIGRPLANFLKYFSQLENHDECILYSNRKIPFDFGPKVKNIVMKERITFWWDQVQLPNAVKKDHLDLFYSPYYKIPLSIHMPTISTIYDVMYLTLKEYQDQLNFFAKSYYKLFGTKYAQKANRILTCSEYSKKVPGEGMVPGPNKAYDHGLSFNLGLLIYFA